MTDQGFVLAIETSQRAQSIAIRTHDAAVHEEVVEADDRTREDLLPAIARRIDRVGCMPEHLRGVMLNAGPGGFTGLRMAHAAAQAIALALQVPVVQVSGAACARAAAILSGDLAPTDACWVALASKGEETWIARADAQGPVEGRSIEVDAWEPGDCNVLVSDAHLPASWRALAERRGIRQLPLRVHASAVLAAGLPMLERGQCTPPEALVPTYPREAEAVRLWRLRKVARADGTPA
ncbi:MAG: tRNA (adenosine(37)-N6)-threonylcarbamoyltransferase complex dimerization subunit type 1 TsaB [Planctomycetota bacterium]